MFELQLQHLQITFTNLFRNGNQIGKKTLHIGGIFPMSADKGGWAGGQACLPAAQLALDDVNKNPTLLNGYELVMTWNDSQVHMVFQSIL